MAHDEDRRWRERMQRDDDNRRYGSGSSRYGEYSNQGSQGSGRGWSEGSEWRNRDRDEWSGSSSGAGYGSRGGSWGDRDRDRWGERSGSDWEQSSWRDADRDRNRYEQGSDSWSGSSSGSSRGYGRDMGQGGQGGWSGGGRDYRQERDYGGSMRAGEYGGRSSSYGGSRYGSGASGGRSGMGYGGGRMGSSSSSQGWSGREYDQFGMSSEPGFGSGYGASGYRGMEQGYGYGGPHDWGTRGSRSDDRGFWDKAADEVSSWFGDEDAERRREMDRRHSGRGPRNYARSDSRINEDVCDRLTEHPMVDASDIEVEVSGREVTLTGTVHSREEKRRAEDIAEAVSGVTHVQNNLRVKQEGDSSVQRTLDSFSNATSGAFGERGGSTMSSRSGSTTSTTGTSGSSSTDASKTTTGSSPGVMRSDPSTSTTKGA